MGAVLLVLILAFPILVHIINIVDRVAKKTPKKKHTCSRQYSDKHTETKNSRCTQKQANAQKVVADRASNNIENFSSRESEVDIDPVYQYDYSRELIKKATSYKKESIEKSIELIYKAMAVCPEKVESDYYKLAHYYYLANQKKKAFTVLYLLRDSFDRFDIIYYNMNRSGVYEKLCTLYYRDKDYMHYLLCYCLWFYNTTIALACQGLQDGFSGVMESGNTLNYLAPTKVKGCFKHLEKEDVIEEFNRLYLDFIIKDKHVLTKMYKKVVKIQNSGAYEDYVYNESSSERENRLLKKDREFMKAYMSLNDYKLELFFEHNLKPLFL